MQPTHPSSVRPSLPSEYTMEAPILLNVYDLSHGRAARMSPFLLGQVIPGIWHTSIEVFGYEYFYGGSIVKMKPRDVRLVLNMEPVHMLKMGTTKASMAEFDQFLCAQLNNFTPEKYDLLTHNCNHFTNLAMQFLNQKSIPKEILDLPQKVSGTIMGRFLLKVLQKATDNSNPVGPVERHVPKRASCYVETDLESDRAVHHGVSRGTWQPMTTSFSGGASKNPLSRLSDGGIRRRDHKKQHSCLVGKEVRSNRLFDEDIKSCITTVAAPRIENKRGSHMSVPPALASTPPSFVCGDNLQVVRSLKTVFPTVAPVPKHYTQGSPRKPRPPALFPVTEPPAQPRRPTLPPFLARGAPRLRTAKRPALLTNPIPATSSKPPPSFVLPTKEHRSVCQSDKDAVSGMMRLLTPRPNPAAESTIIHSPYRQAPVPASSHGNYRVHVPHSQRASGRQKHSDPNVASVTDAGRSKRSTPQFVVPDGRPTVMQQRSPQQLHNVTQPPTVNPPPINVAPATFVGQTTYVRQQQPSMSPLAVIHELDRRAPRFVIPSQQYPPYR